MRSDFAGDICFRPQPPPGPGRGGHSVEFDRADLECESSFRYGRGADQRRIEPPPANIDIATQISPLQSVPTKRPASRGCTAASAAPYLARRWRRVPAERGVTVTNKLY